LNNCIISDNYADYYGGGSYRGTLNNCTVVFNSTEPGDGGGTYDSVLNNCIVWYNTAARWDDNIHGGNAYYCCSPDLVQGVDGNITNSPMFVTLTHIATNSPCRGAGSALYVAGLDVDGESWLDPPSIGCDEWHGVGSVTGSVSAVLFGPQTILEERVDSYFPGFTGPLTKTVVDFRNGFVFTNFINGQIETSWPDPGPVDVLLTCWNDLYPEGLVFTQRIDVLSVAEAVVYVSDTIGDDANDGHTWQHSKKTIQGGVDAAIPGATLWVTNGIYDSGSRMSPAFGDICMTRVVITNDIIVRSVNGPEYTFIVGEGPLGASAVRCVYMGAGVLNGFTITNGHTLTMGGYAESSGGGISMYRGNAFVKNCIVTGNSSYRYGGGIFYGTLHNCAIFGNYTAEKGGGSSSSRLLNCTISGNFAELSAGGAYSSYVENSIVYYNTAGQSDDNTYYCRFYYSCTEPDPGGIGNITEAPLFSDVLAQNYRLQANSPCIDAGNNGVMPFGRDLDGVSRPLDGDADGVAVVDMGCYESPTKLRAGTVLIMR